MKYLLVIPSIDIKDGKTVRVVQGIPELDCLEYGSDPVEMARIWRAENAKIIHIVDFDAAIEHSHKNVSIIEEICNSVIIPVQFAGGVRNFEDARLMIEAGILRLVITTMAIENRAEFLKVFEKFGPTKIVTALDIQDGQIIIRGRQSKTGIFYRDFARDMADIGMERFIVTDVRKNGVLGGPNLEIAEEISELTGGKITLSGGIRNKDELLDVQNMMQFGVDSVIVGRALYENRFPCQKLWRVAESGIFK